ncbi:MAG TPA: adenylate/guanylate cyclase domain-containing protein [Solirubrobacteraceae bacterium]|nr:adenylate/guanylate cyclase domain-containing protein [Solirubrobacteraceae bacterium]
MTTGGATACPRCGTDNGSGAKFCMECGESLSASCPACGHATAPGQKFCSECGTGLSPRLTGTRKATVTFRDGAVATPRHESAELRRVSVLFVDLVDYTSLAESWDPADVRDLLGHYFDAARGIVNRYGGTVEKFIGDAVMAVWGTPVAREDDAERTVRAALELVDAVAALGGTVGAPDLRARAGIVTGQAALLVNREEGVVVGDRVNTAARVQGAADPATVLVDDVTRQVTAAAIAYEDAGRHELKGKSEPLQLWRAVETLAVAPDVDRDGLQAQFVGRDAELRLIKELCHAAVSRSSARLVAVSGAAGVGKTRLRGEFLDYLLKLPDRFLWHPGRCLPYSDGVAYCALAEMVRHRLGIPEDASVEEAASRLRTGLERWVGDQDEREFLSVRLGVLLGVVAAGPGREELFAGWRLFFERLAELDPVVMVFEDMQCADDGLLDFVEYLLDWSASHRIFILILARPELTDRRPGWAAARRGATAISLEPLGDKAMEELIDSVATLPPAAKRRIISHAEGIPLFAIETVRALADRGVLVERDGALVLAGELGELDVPPSLISLLGARLDALGPDERELVRSMSVFGGNFPLAAAQALSGLPVRAADEVLASLVRKQVLTVRADPHSPDRGQYRFGQTLLRTVAYETLPKRERKAKHLAAAQYLSHAFANEGEDVAEVLAAHYLEAYRAAADDSDADHLRSEAIAALRRGAQRAAAVGAPQTAERAYRSAIELAATDDERIALLEAAGDMALIDGRYEASLELLEDAAGRLVALGRERDAARLGPRIGPALWRAGRAAEAIERMRQALAVLGSDTEDADVARMNVTLGVALLSTGHVRDAFAPLDRALELAQALELPDALASALTFKAQLCDAIGRVHEARIQFDGAIELCREHKLTDRLFFAQLNSGDFLRRFDLPGAAERTRDALATARRIGSRLYESIAASNLMRVWEYSGDWDKLEALGADLLARAGERPGAEYLHLELAILAALRGQVGTAREHLPGMTSWQRSDIGELRWSYAACEATIAVAAGEFGDALELLAATMREIAKIEGPASQASRIGFPQAIAAAVTLGRLTDADELLSLFADTPPGHVPLYFRAHIARGRGLIAAARNELAMAEAHLGVAIETLTALGYPYWLATVQTDLARALVDDQRPAEARVLLDQARTALTRLGASSALQRVDLLLAGLPVPAGA